MKRFKNILFYAEEGVNCDQALAGAAKLACGNGAHLTIVDVIPEPEGAATWEKEHGLDLVGILKEQYRTKLEKLAETLDIPHDHVKTQILVGIPFVAIIRTVITQQYDLLIKSAQRNQGPWDQIFGSSDMHLMRKCPCPVWIDRERTVRPYGRILAAVDPSAGQSIELAEKIMQLATSLAANESAQLDVVHCWQADGETMMKSGFGKVPEEKRIAYVESVKSEHAAEFSQLITPFDLNLDSENVHMIKGIAAKKVYELSKEIQADLIIIGTVGRTGIPGFFIGNTAENILQSTQCSVMAVKPEGFVSPVSVEGV